MPRASFPFLVSAVQELPVQEVELLPHEPVSARVLAWTADAERLDPAIHPRLISWIAQRGSWPRHTTRWGTARALKAPGGWAQRLWASGEVVAATITLARPVSTALDAMPPLDALATLRGIATHSTYAPSFGVFRLEWSRRCGWHLEGIVPAAASLEEMPPELGNVQTRPIPDLPTFEAQLRYMSKGCRVDAAHLDRAAHAEKLLELRDANGGRSLPSLTLIIDPLQQC